METTRGGGSRQILGTGILCPNPVPGVWIRELEKGTRGLYVSYLGVNPFPTSDKWN